MVNFKIGDVVRVLGKPETLRTIVGVPLKYATLPWATSPTTPIESITALSLRAAVMAALALASVAAGVLAGA